MAVILGAGAVSPIKAKYIYPEDFFNIPHPANPNVMIQFRTAESTGSTKSISDPNLWSNITFNPNNFFDSFTLEDEGKALKINLSLKDKNHSFLEDKIIRMTQVLNLENEKKKQEPDSLQVKDSVTGDSLAIKSFSSSMVSLRIRFGYSTVNNDNYFSTSSLSNFKERVDDMNKPVVMSPWIYFILTGMEVSIAGDGLSVNIEGVSENAPKLNSLKLIGVGIPLRGTAEEIIKMLGMYLTTIIDNLTIVIKDDPLVADNENQNKELTLDLGEYVDGEIKFKSISELLDNFCKLIHPVYFDEKGEALVPLESYDDISKREEAKHISYNYTWYFYDQDEDEGPKLVFYYRRPDVSQELLRTYTWVEHGQSIIRDLSISSEYLFAQLNIPLFNVSKTGDHKLHSSSIDENGAVSAKDLSDALKDESFGFTFTQGSYYDTTYKEENRNRNPGANKIATLNADLNNMLHEGTITLQGDPFYLFDEVVAPFMYRIRVIVKKPTYINEEGDRVGGGRSYLSGEYVIKKITHELSAGEFNTKLDIQRAL